MLQINNLNKSFGKQEIFDNVTATINSGERVGFVGRNGYGKTTLFRMILDEEHPDSGNISVPRDTGSAICRSTYISPRRRSSRRPASA